MPTIASLAAIPFVVLGVSTATPEVRLDTLQWGSSAAHMASRFPGAAGPVSAADAHDFANGFGIPQQKFRTKAFGAPGTAYALYGRKSKQLVAIYWAPTDPAACRTLAKSLPTALGKPTEIDNAISTTTWENEAGNLDVSFVAHTACHLLLSPSDPFEFD